MGAESRGLCRGIRANRGTGHAYRGEAAPVTREAEKIGFGGGSGGRARRIQGGCGERRDSREGETRCVWPSATARGIETDTERRRGGERRGGERHFRRGRRRWVLVRYR